MSPRISITVTARQVGKRTAMEDLRRMSDDLDRTLRLCGPNGTASLLRSIVERLDG